MAGAILVKKRLPLVISRPGHGAMDEGLCEYQRVPRFHFRLENVVGISLISGYFIGQVSAEVGFMRARNTPKSAIPYTSM